MLTVSAQLNRTGRRCAHVASHSAGGAACACGSGSCGTTSARSLALGARTPWFAQRGSAHLAKRTDAGTKRIRCSLGLGTSAASRCMNSSGDRRGVRGAIAPSGLELEHDLSGGVGLHALVGQSAARDGAAQLLQRLAVVGSAAHGGVLLCCRRCRRKASA